MQRLRTALLLVLLVPFLPAPVAAEAGFECKGPEGEPTACVCHGNLYSPSCKALIATGSCRGTHFCCEADHDNERRYCWCEQGGCDHHRDPIGKPPLPRDTDEPS